MAKYVSDAINIMRLTLGRRNENDPDSSDSMMLTYLNDFINLTMSDDLKIFEQYDTLIFTIDETNTTGVYTFNDVGADSNFVNISHEGFITLTDPPDGSISWNRLTIFQDPGLFYDEWGVDNTDILIPGYPTGMLLYGNQMVFRTIPDQSYDVYIYGYKEQPEFSSEGNPALPYNYWLRYLAYGAALNYARDFRYNTDDLKRISNNFAREREIVATRTFNQAKRSRGVPSF